MDAIGSAILRSLNQITKMGVMDVVDILIVAWIIYKAIWFAKSSNLGKVARGVIFLLALLALSYVFRLTMINFLLRKTVELGLLALVILFQPELRHVLEKMGSGFFSSKSQTGSEMDSAIAHAVLACTDMSASRTGALLIFERQIKLNEIMNTGTIINADVTAELIKNLFYDKAPLHDGAVIVRNGRIDAAGCVLPLTKSNNLSKDLGMRHRAGIGLSEQSDAVVVIVSEETGSISVATDGQLKRHLTATTLERILRSELIQDDADQEKKYPLSCIKKLFRVKNNEEKSDEKIL